MERCAVVVLCTRVLLAMLVVVAHCFQVQLLPLKHGVALTYQKLNC